MNTDFCLTPAMDAQFVILASLLQASASCLLCLSKRHALFVPWMRSRVDHHHAAQEMHEGNLWKLGNCSYQRASMVTLNSRLCCRICKAMPTATSSSILLPTAARICFGWAQASINMLSLPIRLHNMHMEHERGPMHDDSEPCANFDLLPRLSGIPASSPLKQSDLRASRSHANLDKAFWLQNHSERKCSDIDVTTCVEEQIPFKLDQRLPF